MARFPIIDSPCPLSQLELAGIAGHCGRCGKTVHCLDGMDDAGRAAFMSQAKGPVCVSYRMPLAVGAALALSLAAPVLAHDASADAPLHQAIAAPARVESPVSKTSVVAPVDTQPKQLDMVITAGGVHLPAASQWTETEDYGSLPGELPTATDRKPCCTSARSGLKALRRGPESSTRPSARRNRAANIPESLKWGSLSRPAGIAGGRSSACEPVARKQASSPTGRGWPAGPERVRVNVKLRARTEPSSGAAAPPDSRHSMALALRASFAVRFGILPSQSPGGRRASRLCRPRQC